MSVAYSVRTQGYPQTSGILTTAYEAENGYVYVYFFDNYTASTDWKATANTCSSM